MLVVTAFLIGTLTSTFTHGLVPWTMSHTRDAHFIVDASGVTSYYEILSFVTVSTTNSTCMATGGSAQVTVSGGAAPYTYPPHSFYSFIHVILLLFF